jgi:hypothetical protein
MKYALHKIMVHQIKRQFGSGLGFSVVVLIRSASDLSAVTVAPMVSLAPQRNTALKF